MTNTQTTVQTVQMAVKFSHHKTLLAVDSFAEAQKAVNTLRDNLEMAGCGGASHFPTVRIIDVATGRTIAHVSYNGRIWEGAPRTWTPSTREIVCG